MIRVQQEYGDAKNTYEYNPAAPPNAGGSFTAVALGIGGSIPKYKVASIFASLDECLNKYLEAGAPQFPSRTISIKQGLDKSKESIIVVEASGDILTNVTENDIYIQVGQNFAVGGNTGRARLPQLVVGQYRIAKSILMESFKDQDTATRPTPESQDVPPTFAVSNGAGSAANPLVMTFGGDPIPGNVYSALFDTDVTSPATLSVTAEPGDESDNIAQKFATLIDGVPEWSATPESNRVIVAPVLPATSISITGPAIS